MACAGASWPLTPDLFSSAASCQRLVTKEKLHRVRSRIRRRLDSSQRFSSEWSNLLKLPDTSLLTAERLVKQFKKNVTVFAFLSEPKHAHQQCNLVFFCSTTNFCFQCWIFVLRVNSRGYVGIDQMLLICVRQKATAYPYLFKRGIISLNLINSNATFECRIISI